MEELCPRCIVPDEKVRIFLMYLLHYDPDLVLMKMTFVQSDIVYGFIIDKRLTQIVDEKNKHGIRFELKEQTIEMQNLADLIKENNGIVVNLSSYDLIMSNDMKRFVDLHFLLY
jgi:hypothetical protein